MTPNWDLRAYFGKGREAQHACAAFREALLEQLHQLEARGNALAPPSESTIGEWAELLLSLEDASSRLAHLGSYVSCLVSADSRHPLGRREESRLAPLYAAIERARIAAGSKLASAEEHLFATLLERPDLAPVAYYVTRERERARRAMAPELESLAADLRVDGLSAWGRLYGRIAGQLRFELELPGELPREVAVSMTRSLLEDADPAVRRAALRGSARAWESASESVAACLNAICGTRLALSARRGEAHFLDSALFDAGISRATLDALLDSVRSRQELARRYLRRKAQLLGVERLGFQDLMAPFPGAGAERIPWPQAKERVLRAFRSSYPALTDCAERAIAERWIDHSPRAHKRPGAFCTGSDRIHQSRVFLTYNGAPGDVFTLAHELGHAFHNQCTADLRHWQARYPLTLAETASTFAEQVVTSAALDSRDTSPAERASILDTCLSRTETFLLNIPMRFDFECDLYTRRAQGELGVEELCERMLEAQRRNYGDALDPDQLDPWFWASKLHFYITGVSFYNFPYVFGFLFSHGLVARFQKEGRDFLPRYEALLRSAGQAPAEIVARDALGVDLERPEFWSESIDALEPDLDRYLELTSSAIR